MKRAVLALALPILFSCAHHESPASRADASAKMRLEGVNAVLWVQHSAEYEAAARQTFRAALTALRLGLRGSLSAELTQKPRKEALPPAVIMDVDDTILSGTSFQATVIKGAPFTLARWHRWLARGDAPAVPGAKEFIAAARALKVTIFLVTNRPVAFKSATERNLILRGITPGPSVQLLMKDESRGWTAAKHGRRRFIASRYHIVLLIGDDLNDFIPSAKLGQKARQRIMKQHGWIFGERWFIVPNPYYGSWEDALLKGRRGPHMKHKLNLLRTPTRP